MSLAIVIVFCPSYPVNREGFIATNPNVHLPSGDRLHEASKVCKYEC